MENKTGTATKQVKENNKRQSDSAYDVKEKTRETEVKPKRDLSDAAPIVHEKSDSATEILDTGADNINKYAHQVIDKASKLGLRAADAISNSSEYLGNFDYSKTKQQVIKTVKNKPQIGFAIAGLLGLIIGLFIGRKKPKIT